MFARKNFAIVMLVIVLSSVFAVLPIAQAQDMSEPVVCDSTLVTLLLVAEHDYDYLSHMMMDDGHMPNVELGQYKGLIDGIIAMMTSMQGDMSEEEMAMMADHEAHVMEMMSMSDEELLNMYMDSMNMSSDDSAMMHMLMPGAVTGEDPACATLREDVQHFLLVHVVASMSQSDM